MSNSAKQNSVMLVKKIVTKILVFGKSFRITLVSMAKKLYSQFLEFGNHGNNKRCIKAVFDSYKEGNKRNIGFWKIIRDNCGVHGLSAYILEFGNHGYKQNCIK